MSNVGSKEKVYFVALTTICFKSYHFDKTKIFLEIVD